MMRILVFVLFTFMAVGSMGCGKPAAKSAKENDENKNNYIELALSSPNYLDDFNYLHTKLKEEEIGCIEGPSSLGALSLMVDSMHFEKAKTFSDILVRQKAMTIRLKKDRNSEIFEVFTKGKKTAEETYVINAADK